VVVHFDLDAALLQVQDHLGAQVLVLVHGGNGEVTFFVPNLIAEVGLVSAFAGVPKTFTGIDVVVPLMVVLVEPDAVEDKKLDLGPPVADVGKAGGLQILLGFLGNVSGIASIGLTGDGIQNVTDKADRGMLGKWVHHGGVGIRYQNHVGFVDRLKSPDAGAVKAQTVFECIRR